MAKISVTLTGIHLDRDSPVPADGSLVDRGKDVASGPDVVGGDGEDRGVHVGAAGGQVTQLVVVTVTFGQSRGEDRGVCRHPDHVPAGDEGLQGAAGQ